jgi:hypothetical protein
MTSINPASKPARQGKPWTEDEDQLIEELFYQSKKLDEIVNLMERSPAGIYFRLKGKGLIPEDLLQEELPRFLELNRQRGLSKNQLQENLRNRTVVLIWWQEANWNLEPDQQGRFLHHPTLAKIVEMIPEDVKFAIKELSLRKLDEIYGYSYGQYRLKKQNNLINEKSFEKYRRLKMIAYEKFINDLTKTYGRSSDEIRMAKRISRRNLQKIVPKNVERGSKSLRKYGLVNPPPEKQVSLHHTSLYRCTICNKPVVGNSCACDGY